MDDTPILCTYKHGDEERLASYAIQEVIAEELYELDDLGDLDTFVGVINEEISDGLTYLCKECAAEYVQQIKERHGG